MRGELGRRGGVGVDSAVLAVAFVLLYGDGILELWRVAGRAEIITRAEMLGTGYPDPGGSLYYGLPLAGAQPMDLALWRSRITRERAEALVEAARGSGGFGEPTPVTWLELVQGV